MWKLLLRIDQVSAQDYLQWVDMGPSEVSAKSECKFFFNLLQTDNSYRIKVRNDTFRTLATDLSFKGKVREDMLIRLLEAFAWKNKESQAQEQYSGLPAYDPRGTKRESSTFEFAYVQGQSPFWIGVAGTPDQHIVPFRHECSFRPFPLCSP